MLLIAIIPVVYFWVYGRVTYFWSGTAVILHYDLLLAYHDMFAMLGKFRLHWPILQYFYARILNGRDKVVHVFACT